MNKLRLKVQIALSYVIIATACVKVIFSLGFMSGFYTLFMNGNNEMYTFFKDIQVLNTSVFTSSLIFLVLSLFLISFDINKKTAGIFGILFTLIIAITNIVNGASTFSIRRDFRLTYSRIDFSGLEGYEPSVLPFELLDILTGLSIVLTVSLFVLTTGNYLLKKKGTVGEK